MEDKSAKRGSIGSPRSPEHLAGTVLTTAALSPHGVDQACDRINENTADDEQDCPYQIIDLFLEFGESLRSLLRSPHKEGTQQENSRHGSRDDDHDLVHRACPSVRTAVQESFNKRYQALDASNLLLDVAHVMSRPNGAEAGAATTATKIIFGNRQITVRSSRASLL